MGPPRFTVTLKAEEGVLALEGHLPGGRALGALCAERPFLTSAIMELRVPQVRRLPACISRMDTTHKCLSLFEALGRPRPLIFVHAFALRMRTPLLPAALAFVSFGFVLARV